MKETPKLVFSKEKKVNEEENLEFRMGSSVGVTLRDDVLGESETSQPWCAILFISAKWQGGLVGVPVHCVVM